MKQTNYAKSIFLLLLFVSLIVFAAVLKLTASVVLPLTVSILLAFVFYPFIKNLNKKAHLPWLVGILIVVILAIAAFYLIGNILVASISAIINSFPKYEERFSSLYEIFINTFNIQIDENSSILENLWKSLEVRNFLQRFLVSFSNFIISSAKVILLVALFVIFLLFEMKDMKLKIREAFQKENTSRKVMFIATKTISQVTHYISIKFLISLMTGIFVGLSCLIIKMDFPIVWGFLAFILNFIPNFGSIFAWIVTTLFALIQFYPSWGQIIFIAVALLTIEMTLGNFVEPRWEGSDLGISPFVILVSLSVWMWMWGFIGAILSVPMMVIIKIICENIDFLKPVAIILGNNPKQKKFQFFKKAKNKSSSIFKNLKKRKDSQNQQNPQKLKTDAENLETQENFQNQEKENLKTQSEEQKLNSEEDDKN